MLRRLLPGAIAGLLLTGAFIAAEGCSSFEEAAATADATDETALTDSLVVDEPGQEASVEAGSFCTTRAAAFCADFETPPVGRGWTEALISGDAATVSLLDGGSEASPLHAAGCFVGADPSAPSPDAAMGDAQPNPTYALLAKEIATLTATRISLELDLRVDAVPMGDPGALAAVCSISDNADNNMQPSVFLTFRRDSSVPNGLSSVLGVDLGNGPEFQGMAIQPRLHAWFHVRLSVDRSARLVQLQIDGVELLGKQPTPLFAESKVLDISAGIFGFANREDMSVAVDNVVVDLLEPP